MKYAAVDVNWEQDIEHLAVVEETQGVPLWTELLHVLAPRCTLLDKGEPVCALKQVMANWRSVNHIQFLLSSLSSMLPYTSVGVQDSAFYTAMSPCYWEYKSLKNFARKSVLHEPKKKKAVHEWRTTSNEAVVHLPHQKSESLQHLSVKLKRAQGALFLILAGENRDAKNS